MTVIFLSHASWDDAVSKRLLAGLKDAGYAALFLDVDPHDGIPAGRVWERELYAQLRRADAVVFLASPASVASRWCHSELVLARSVGKPIFPVTIAPTERHPLLAEVQAVDATDDPVGGLERLCDGLRRAGLDPSDSFAWDPNRPAYPGLVGFDAADAAVFFGRGSEISDLLEALQPTVQRDRGRFVAVVGPSGSGKSSLVRAGLVPRLRRQGHRWLVLPPLRPGSRPLGHLARSLAAATNRPEHGHARGRVAVEQRLAAGPEGLVDLLHDRCAQAEGSPSRALVVVDQAEELLTRCGETERLRFLRLLHGALHPDSPLEVVATVRSEFLSELITDGGIADVIDVPFVVGPLPRSRLPEVIVGPARRAGLRFEPGLVERMVENTRGGDALPLLAFTLERLAERPGPDGELTGDDYVAVGGVVGALTSQADATAARLAADGKGAAVLPTLLRLVTVEADGEPTARRVPLDSFTGDAEAVVRAFVDARLLTTDHSEGTTTVAVAHESLLRQWPPLREHVAASREALVLRADLERSARDWHAADRDESYLLRGVRLAEVAEAAPEHLRHLDKVERDFIAASQDLADREIERAKASNRRLRRLVAGLAVLAVIAVAGAGVAIRQSNEADRQSEVATQQTRYRPAGSRSSAVPATCSTSGRSY